PISTAVATSRGSERMRTTSAVSIATSVPAPIAIPTSAWASAGASLIPSPTIATRRPSLQLLHFLRLVLRQHLGDHLVAPELGGDPFGGLAVVAGEHHRPDPDLLQRRDRRRRGLARRVRDRNDADRAAVADDVHDRPALAGEFLCPLRESVQTCVLALEQARVADREPVTLDGRDRAVPGDRLEGLRTRRLEAALVRGAHDRRGERMLALAFHRRGEPQQFVLADTVLCDHCDDLRL